jgi:WD40 repeat protein
METQLYDTSTSMTVPLGEVHSLDRNLGSACYESRVHSLVPAIYTDSSTDRCWNIFFSRAIFDPSHHDDSSDVEASSGTNSTTTQLLDSSGPLFKRNLLTEPSVIQFLCERVQQQLYFEIQLLSVIEQSKTDATVATAATNAITILVRAGVPFNGVDLRGIRIPGADLSNGQFDSTLLRGADLTGVNFARSWLRQADFGNAQMEGVRFEELPYQNVVRNVFSCQYSPDGRILAVGSLWGGLYIYETVGWTRLHRYKHSDSISSLAFSSDSQHLVLGSWDNMVTLWEISCEKTLFVFKGHTGIVHSVALSPCGKRIASASHDTTVRLWSSETGETLFVLEGHIKGVAHVRYSADGQKLFSVCLKGEIREWDPETGKLIADRMTSRSYSYDSPLAFSADGEWCAFALDNNKDGHEKVQILNMITGGPGLILDETGQVCNIAFSSDGQRITLSGDDNTIRLWDISSGVLVSSYSGHISEVRACTFSPDGQHLASGDKDGFVRLWEVNLNQSIFDSQRLSTAVKTVAYSSDGQCILSGRDGFTIQQWNSLTGVSEPIPAEMARDVYSFAFSSDGRWIAIGVEGDAIRILRSKTYVVERTLLGHTMGVHALAFSPCGRWLVSCSWDGTARLWDLQDTKIKQNVIFELGGWNMDDFVHFCAFLPTGHQFVIGTSDFVGVFDVRTGGSPSGTFEKRMVCSMYSLACSPDGQRVALGGGTSSIYLWDLYSTKPHHELEGHTDDIICVAYSPCGKWILSGSADRTIRLWHLRTGEVDDWSCVVAVGGSSDTVESLAWNPVVPMEFASGCRDGSVRVWRILTGGEGDGEYASVRMLWGHDVARLAASDSMIKDVIGLSAIYQKLLVQRGAINSLSSEEGDGSADEEDW